MLSCFFFDECKFYVKKGYAEAKKVIFGEKKKDTDIEKMGQAVGKHNEFFISFFIKKVLFIIYFK